MTAFSFQTVPSIKFGEPAAEALAAMVSGFGANRLMIVSDRGVVGAGLVEPVQRSLTELGLTVLVHDDVEADPPEAKVLEAVAAAQAGARLISPFPGRIKE